MITKRAADNKGFDAMRHDDVFLILYAARRKAPAVVRHFKTTAVK